MVACAATSNIGWGVFVHYEFITNTNFTFILKSDQKIAIWKIGVRDILAVKIREILHSENQGRTVGVITVLRELK